MATSTIIQFERTADDDRISLFDTYPTHDEAYRAMRGLYDTKMAESDEWCPDLCGITDTNAVVQDEYRYCYRWFIFDSDDYGMKFIFS